MVAPPPRDEDDVAKELEELALADGVPQDRDIQDKPVAEAKEQPKGETKSDATSGKKSKKKKKVEEDW